MRLKKIPLSFFLAGFVVLAVALHAFKPPRIFWKTLVAYTNLVVREGAWRPLNLLTKPPRREERVIPSGDRELHADIYYPQTFLIKREYPGVLLFTPMVPGTRRDPRVVNLADTLSRLGYVVLVPERPEEEGTKISRQDIEDAKAGWRALHDLPDVRDEDVAGFGLSYGFGPVFLAAVQLTNEGMRIPFIAGFGGYAEAKEILRYGLTGAYAYKDIKGIVEPDPWLTDLIKNNVERIVPASDARQAFLDNTDADRFDELYNALPQAFHEQTAAFSPASLAHDLRIPLVLIHSTDDNVIPYTESLRLRDLLPDRVASLSFVSIFVHGAYKPLSWQSWWQEYLPSFRDSFRFLYTFLSL